MHCSCDKASKQTNIHLLVALPLVRTNNGPAKSTPVKLNAGSSLILLTDSGVGDGAGNSHPSHLQQITHQWLILRIKLLSFTIQNFLSPLSGCHEHRCVVHMCVHHSLSKQSQDVCEVLREGTWLNRDIGVSKPATTLPQSLVTKKQIQLCLQ